MKIKFIFSVIFFISTFNNYANTLYVTSLSESDEGSLNTILGTALSGDTIKFNIPNSQSSTISLTRVLNIIKNVAINGINIANGDTIIIKQSTNYERVINIKGKNTNVIFENLKITNGTKGAIFVEKWNILTLNNCKVYSNSNYDDNDKIRFGAIYADTNSSLYLNNCKIFKNNVGSFGGGIIGNYAYIEMNNTLLTQNGSSYTVDIYGGKMVMKDCKVNNNVSGIFGIYAQIYISKCTFDRNIHTGNQTGGGLAIYADCSAYVEDSNFSNNIAGDGAGIGAWGGSLAIKRSKISNNQSTTWGGGIFFSGKDLLIDSCVIQNNTAYNQGGGVLLWSGDTIYISNSIIDNNKATNGASSNSGGGISAIVPFTLINSTISNNSATMGAGLSAGYVSNGCTLINNTFYNNKASKYGGGIYFVLIYGSLKDFTYYYATYPESTILNNTITNNSANAGGGIYVEPSNSANSGYGTLNLYNNLIAKNNMGDFVIKKDTTITTYIKGKCNISIIPEDLINNTSEFINYNSSTALFETTTPVLTDNGGFAPTIKLSSMSIAIGKGVAAVQGFDIPTTDARGQKRSYRPCIGSFEYPIYPYTPIVILPATDITKSGFKANWELNNDATGYYLDVSLDNFRTYISNYQNKYVGNNSSETLTGLPSNANYQYRIRLTDGTKISYNSDTISVQIISDPELKIMGFNPKSGYMGDQVTITGLGFNSISAKDTVYFAGNIKAKVISATDSTIIVTVPYVTLKGLLQLNTNGLSTVSDDTFEPLLLSSNNYQIKSTNCTCPGSNDGKINMTLLKQLNYSVTTKSNTLNKTEIIKGGSYNLSNLSSGNYEVTFNIDGVENYSQPFNIYISEPQNINVYRINSQNDSVIYKLNDGEKYYIYNNGNIFETQESEIKIPLKEGVNNIRIYTDKLCQGIFEENIFYPKNKTLLFPNPTTGESVLFLPENEKEVSIQITSINGNVLFNEKLLVQSDNSISLDLSSFVRGCYLIKVNSNSINNVIKLIKR